MTDRRRWDWAEVAENEARDLIRLRDLEDELATCAPRGPEPVAEYEPEDDVWHGMATHEREEEEHGNRP